MRTFRHEALLLPLLLLFSGVYAVPDSSSPAERVPKPTAAVSPEAELLSAKALPCSTAVPVYEKLAADSAYSDSLRKAACCSRADIAFSLREYETAFDYYKKAARFEKEQGRCHYRLGLAALANGDTAGAEGFFRPIADSGDNEFRYLAEVKLGECALSREKFLEAMACFQKAGPFSWLNSWSVPALLGRLECARHLGLADSAAKYDKQLSAHAKTILEKERLRKIRMIPLGVPAADTSVASGKPAAVVVTAVPKNRDTALKSGGEVSKDSAFSLQVGAFGSKERAQALTKKMVKKFKDAACVPALVDERTFYRVWVGNFESREEAESFGKEKLLRQGLIYRVVVK
jgi:tetratricopeptide (TPR) repeat protein